MNEKSTIPNFEFNFPLVVFVFDSACHFRRNFWFDFRDTFYSAADKYKFYGLSLSNIF